ncbi:MAG TPA: response regulator [Burkholderiaceae bacterium]|nr:response regulator [Burkholderiaceae bacterium]
MSLPSPSGRRFHGARILLVDDNPINRDVATGLLELLDVVVEPAGNGQEAVAMAAQRRYDLILMDVQMPVLDGLEATRRIRRLPHGDTVPIVAMTADAFEEDRRRCLDAGMCDHLSKPVEFNALEATLARWIGRVAGDPSRHDGAASSGGRSDAAPTAAGTLPGVDGRLGMKIAGGEIGAFRELMRRFVRHGLQEASQLAQHVSQAELEEAGRRAHSIAGSAGMVGAYDISRHAVAIVALIRQGSGAPALAEPLGALRAALAALDEALAPDVGDGRAPPTAGPT